MRIVPSWQRREQLLEYRDWSQVRWILIAYFPFLWHQLIVEQQDEQLELVSGSIGVLKNMSQRIGGELEEQAV